MLNVYFAAVWLMFAACNTSSQATEAAPTRTAEPHPPLVRKPQVPTQPLERPPTPPGQPPYPVQLVGDFGVSAARLSEGLTAEHPDGLGRVAKDGESVEPLTCQRWLNLRQAGFTPPQAIEEQAFVSAQRLCGTLQLLEHAQNATQSLVRTLALDATFADKLPAAVAPTSNRSEEAQRTSAQRQGKSLTALYPMLDFKPRANTLWAEDTAKQRFVALEVTAYGDTNGDGQDDLILSVTHGALAGSLLASRLFVLTGDAHTGRLRLLQAF